MSSGSFEKNSLDWQLQLVQRQFGEWWELKMSQVPLDQPQGALPSWLLSPILGQVIRITFWLLVAVILSLLGVRLLRGLNPYIISYYQQLTQAANRVTKRPVPELSVLTLPVLKERGFLDQRLDLLNLTGIKNSRGQISPSVWINVRVA